MYCMENVNINFSTFFNFAYKLYDLSSNNVFSDKRLWSIVFIFSGPDPGSGRTFQISGSMTN